MNKIFWYSLFLNGCLLGTMAALAWFIYLGATAWLVLAILLIGMNLSRPSIEIMTGKELPSGEECKKAHSDE